MARAAPVVLFDGTCNFCDGAVHFVIDHERDARLIFAALQSEAWTALLHEATTPDEAKRLREGVSGSGDPDSVAFVEDGMLYTH